ncbi:MAG: response regulator [Planctomycetes bacterium]|nr:response regulator [Planctomycetota bacterium]MBI3846960.1 response regulator [Planctomycetota bacterium]
MVASNVIRRARARVLVVEDDDDLRASIGEFLEARGFAVDRAADALQAVARIGVADYDVVVTDIRMPGPSGLAVAYAAQSCARPAVVVVITAYPEWYDVAEALDPFEIVRKPFRLRALAKTVARAAHEHDVQSPAG